MLELVQEIPHVQKHSWSVSWHPSGELFAVGGSDKNVTIYKKVENQFVADQVIDKDHSKSIRSVSFSSSGSMLAVGSFDSIISVYHIVDGVYQLLSTLEGHDSEVKCVSWSPCQKHLASASRDKNIWIWEYDQTSCEFVCLSVLQGHTQDVKWVNWLTNHKLASGSYDNSIIIWEKQDDDYAKKQVISENASIVWSLSNIGQHYIFAVSEDRTLKLLEYNEQKDQYNVALSLPDIHSRPIYTCSINNNSTILATSGGDNCINLFDISKVKDHQVEKIYELKDAHQNDINCIKFHPTSNSLLTCGDDNIIRLWKLNI